MAENGSAGGELTPRQRRAIAALLASRDVKAAAAAASVGERTLYRWLAQDPQFRAALTQAETELIGESTRRLIAGQALALDTLEGLMAGAQRDSDRRLAAAAWLDFVLRWRELTNVEQRLAELERIVYGEH
jgi:hypothetical protein